MPYGIGRVRYIDDTQSYPKLSKALFIRVLKYFRPYIKQLAVAVLAILSTSILGLIPPLLLRSIVDTALPQKNIKLLGVLVLISISTTVVISLIQVGQTYLNTWISKHIIYNIKNEMYVHLQYMPLSFFSSAKPGEIITHMTSDIDGIQEIFNTTVVNAMNSIFVLITTAATLIYMNWKLAIIGMITLPLFILPTRKVGKTRWKIALKSQERLAELNQIIQETLGISGSILMKIFTKEKDESAHFEKVNDDVIRLQIKESLAGRWFIMTIQIFMTIGPMLIYFFGGLLLVHGELTIGGIVAFVALLSKLYNPVTQISNIHIDVTRSFALFGRIFDYLDKDQEIVDKPDAEALSITAGEIKFENVYFSYNNSKDALNNISFTAEPGTVTALVGPSGAGKTTITNLIPRLYDVTNGVITIDGIDIRNVTIESLRKQVGIVMQEPYLFNSTIKDNLLYSRKNATDDEIISACKSAYIHDFIMSLPQGYDTVVGNRGIKLSGGEKQRISIARVILKDPKIIVLDEATSSLDSVSEDYIQKAMVPLLKGRTGLVIAHRLSTVLSADHIIVIEDGSIKETGTHEELLRLGGLYTKLYQTQFKAQEKVLLNI
ncbi:MAG: ABC transporter ATP-binding protein [Bacillota bacterium]|nr:ABC transporter ATP-binding protein [Bacillota bacterium]